MTKTMNIKILTALLFATYTQGASEQTTGAGDSTVHIQAVYTAAFDQDGPMPLQGYAKQPQQAEQPPRASSDPQRHVPSERQPLQQKPDTDAPRWLQD